MTSPQEVLNNYRTRYHVQGEQDRAFVDQFMAMSASDQAELLIWSIIELTRDLKSTDRVAISAFNRR